jgi:hypothetical protein
VRGASEIEQMADRVEKRRAARIRVTFRVRKLFLKACMDIAERKRSGNKIHRNDLVQLRDNMQRKVDENGFYSVSRWLLAYIGFRNTNVTLLNVYNRAIEKVDEIEGDGWLYYKDFNFYDTKLESKWPWMRFKAFAAFLIIGGFYTFTPILFCSIIGDKQVCPDDPTGQNRWYYGWLTAIYFASVTMSTVG